MLTSNYIIQSNFREYIFSSYLFKTIQGICSSFINQPCSLSEEAVKVMYLYLSYIPILTHTWWCVEGHPSFSTLLKSHSTQMDV